MTSGIVISNATKQYKDIKALNNVSVTIKSNKIYGLLGKNGAGKSTLIKAIGNKIFINEGTILIDQEDNNGNENALSKIYIMSEAHVLPNFNCKTLFKLSKDFNPKFDINLALKMAELFNLDINKRIKKLSTGYNTISKFILAMASGVDYIFLDEPVLGLDSEHRNYVYKLILDLHHKNESTIIISTHLIDEIQNLLEEIIIIKNGNILENSTKDELLESYYFVKGLENEVSNYISDLTVIKQYKQLGYLVALIKGKIPKSIPNLEINKAGLEELFTNITSNEEGKYEIFSKL